MEIVRSVLSPSNDPIGDLASIPGVPVLLMVVVPILIICTIVSVVRAPLGPLGKALWVLVSFVPALVGVLAWWAVGRRYVRRAAARPPEPRAELGG